MLRTNRKIAAAATGAVLLTAGGLGAVPASAATPASSVATCRTTDLQASLQEPLAGGMNHAGYTLQLKNTSSHTCAMRGYPGLALENARHEVLSTDTNWGSTWYAKDPGKKTIYLEPGRTAEANLAWTHTRSNARHAAFLQVTPPGATTHRTIAFSDYVDNGRLDVTALAHDVPVNG
ncbi:DUF4232 domain-containing protein [Streptomyces sp. DT171]|uniref:DUF4232 domain-containing protein n=1 Tax=Streptomyces sp. DT171 TaxID=3416524 RepID=UPI003CE92118